MTAQPEPLTKCSHPECERDIVPGAFACGRHWMALSGATRGALRVALASGGVLAGATAEEAVDAATDIDELLRAAVHRAAVEWGLVK